MEAEEKKRHEEEGDSFGETPRGAPVEVTLVGGYVPSPDDNSDFPGFYPEHAHLLLQEIYGDLPNHNGGARLDRVIMDDAVWQSCWRRLAVQSSSWYTTLS